MNYIGSKYSLMEFLKASIAQTLQMCNEQRPSTEMVFVDLFAGTGVVGGTFKVQGYTVIANDIQYYSYALIKHIMENNTDCLDEERCQRLVDKLNRVEGIEGFIYKNYSYEGTEGQPFRRMYFSEHNAKKCDAIRTAIEKWFDDGEINGGEYFFLLGSLLNSIDKYANTASVYGAFLKQLKRSAQTEMKLLPLPVVQGNAACKAYNEDARQLIKDVSGDILYLDPPYNARQYCSNYHILETIARYDNPVIRGENRAERRR